LFDYSIVQVYAWADLGVSFARHNEDAVEFQNSESSDGRLR
jgi:hypothetical protein